MKNSITIYKILLICVICISITSCKEATPTTDPDLVITNIALTVQVDLTNTARPKPTNTPTTAPTSTPTLKPTLAETIIESTPTTDLTTTTPTTPPQGNEDNGVWVISDPPDGAKVVVGEDFKVAFRLMNTGTSTWTTGYYIKFNTGVQMGAPDKIMMPYEVPAGKSVDLTIEFEAPETAGIARSDWFLVNADNINFYTFYFEYEVVPNE